jgi:hypothetical protein
VDKLFELKNVKVHPAPWRIQAMKYLNFIVKITTRYHWNYANGQGKITQMAVKRLLNRLPQTYFFTGMTRRLSPEGAQSQ